MASKLDLIIEAEKRGILPPQKQAFLNEARKRGLLQSGEGGKPVVKQEYSPYQYPRTGKATPVPKGFVEAFEGATRKYEGMLTSSGETWIDRNLPRLARDMVNAVTQIAARPYDLATGDNFSKRIDDKVKRNNIADDAYDRTMSKFEEKVNRNVFGYEPKLNEFGYPEADNWTYYPEQAENILSGMLFSPVKGGQAVSGLTSLANTVRASKQPLETLAKAGLKYAPSGFIKNIGQRAFLAGQGAVAGEAITPTEVDHDEGETLGGNKARDALVAALVGESLPMVAKGAVSLGKSAKNLIKGENPLEDILVEVGTDPKTGEILYEQGKVNNIAERDLLNVVDENPEIIDKLPEAQKRFEYAQTQKIPLGTGEAMGGQMGNKAAAFATSGRQYARDADQQFTQQARGAIDRTVAGVSPQQLDNVEAGTILQNANKQRQEQLLKDTQDEASTYYDAAKKQVYSKDMSEPVDTLSEADYADIGGYSPDELLKMAQGKPYTPRKLKPYKRNVIQTLINEGGINPNSKFARELYASGITPKAAPTLFNYQGRSDFDNIPMSEWGYEFDGLYDDGAGYLDQNSLLDRIIDETFPDRRSLYNDSYQRVNHSRMYDEQARVNERKKASDYIRSLGLDPALASKADIEDALKRLNTAKKLPSSDPDYLDNLDKGESVGAGEVPSRPFQEDVILKKIDDRKLLQSKTYNKYVQRMAEDLPDTFRDNGGQGNTVGNAILTRHYLQEEIARIKESPSQNNTKIAELQAVVNDINEILKQDYDIKLGDDIYQRMYAEKSKRNKSLVGTYANTQDAQVGGLVNRAFEPKVSVNQFREITKGISEQDKQALAGSYLQDQLDNIKAEDGAYAQLYQRILGSSKQKDKMRHLLGDRKYTELEQLFSTLKGVNDRKFLSGGSNTANKLEAENVRNRIKAFTEDLPFRYRDIPMKIASKAVEKIGERFSPPQDFERDAFNLLVNPEGAKRAFELIALQNRIKPTGEALDLLNQRIMQQTAPYRGYMLNQSGLGQDTSNFEKEIQKGMKGNLKGLSNRDLLAREFIKQQYAKERKNGRF